MRKPPNYWNFERCKEAAFNCESRIEFHDKEVSAYNSSWENNWLDEICSHMIPLGNICKRLVYSYEFTDNYVYVGLTFNEKRRNNSHLNNSSPVHDHILESNLQPIKKVLSDGYVEVAEAQRLEKYWLEYYIDNGFNILNNKKTGGLGGNVLFWTKEKCHEAALKCNSRKEFSDKYISAYIASRKNKWLDEICVHMIRKRKPHNYWNYNTCKEAALNSKTRSLFSKQYSRAYMVSLKNNWLDEFFPVI